MFRSKEVATDRIPGRLGAGGLEGVCVASML